MPSGNDIGRTVAEGIKCSRQHDSVSVGALFKVFSDVESLRDITLSSAAMATASQVKGLQILFGERPSKKARLVDAAVLENENCELDVGDPVVTEIQNLLNEMSDRMKKISASLRNYSASSGLYTSFIADLMQDSSISTSSQRLNAQEDSNDESFDEDETLDVSAENEYEGTQNEDTGEEFFEDAGSEGGDETLEDVISQVGELSANSDAEVDEYMDFLRANLPSNGSESDDLASAAS